MTVPDPRRLPSLVLVLLGMSLSGLAPMAAAQSLGMELAAAPPETEVNQWTVETSEAMPEAGIAAAAEDVLGPVDNVEPLFPDEREAGLENLYILQIAEPVDQRRAYDLTYRLRALPAFDNAAPDFSYHAPYARRHAVSGCGSNLPDPPEKGWSLMQINAQEAWAKDPEPEGRRFGEGIKICHPDTGWADHTDLDRKGLDLDADKDIIDDDDTALDPLDYEGSPGHGTATGSVLMSRGGVDANGQALPPGEVTGVAPKAIITPIRSIKSVVQFLDSDVARAVNYARRQDCDVISMSLGGAGFFGLEKIVNRAVRNNGKIVVAAAGNCVGVVVAPASYPAVIAVAASNIHEEPWKDSSHGTAVAIAAPGERVYVARRKSGHPDLDKVEASDGTSYATTAVAAAAANWLAFHGREAVDAARGSHPLAALFRSMLVKGAKRPAGWDADEYGAGLLDLQGLLDAKLSDFPKQRAVAPPAEGDALTLLSRTLGLTQDELARVLTARFESDDYEALAAQYGPEITRLAVTEPDVIEALLEPPGPGLKPAPLTGEVTDRFSGTLRGALAR